MKSGAKKMKTDGGVASPSAVRRQTNEEIAASMAFLALVGVLICVLVIELAKVMLLLYHYF